MRFGFTYKPLLCPIKNKQIGNMKTFITILVAIVILYIGRDTETRITIEKGEPTHHFIKSHPVISMPYQHSRIRNAYIEIVIHDVWESRFMYLRLPLNLQECDRLELNNAYFTYQTDTVCQLLSGLVLVQKCVALPQKAYQIDILLSYCIRDRLETVCAENIPLRVIY